MRDQFALRISPPQQKRLRYCRKQRKLVIVILERIRQSDLLVSRLPPAVREEFVAENPEQPLLRLGGIPQAAEGLARAGDCGGDQFLGEVFAMAERQSESLKIVQERKNEAFNLLSLLLCKSHVAFVQLTP